MKLIVIIVVIFMLSGCSGLERYKKYIWPDKKEQRMIAPIKSDEHIELIEKGEMQLFEMKEYGEEKKTKKK